MDPKDQEMVERLLPDHPELKDLWDKHREYEKKLKKLESKNFLTPNDRQEKKRLQLAKLTGKTRIEQILMKHRREAS